MFGADPPRTGPVLAKTTQNGFGKPALNKGTVLGNFAPKTARTSGHVFGGCRGAVLALPMVAPVAPRRPLAVQPVQPLLCPRNTGACVACCTGHTWLVWLHVCMLHTSCPKWGQMPIVQLHACCMKPPRPPKGCFHCLHMLACAGVLHSMCALCWCCAGAVQPVCSWCCTGTALAFSL